MIRGGARFGAGLAFVAAVSGCGSYMRMPANVEATQAEVQELRRQQAETLTLIEELKIRLGGQGNDVVALRADTNTQLRELGIKIEALLARLDEQGARPERIRPRPTPPPRGVDSTLAPSPPPAGADADVFLAAQQDFSRGNYQLAIAGFRDYLQSSPDPDRADDAQYWIGESYYSLGEMDRAIQELLRVRDLYPRGDKRAAATLKIGYAFLRKQNPASARRYFQMVTRDYPGSDEARLAEDKLRELQ